MTSSTKVNLCYIASVIIVGAIGVGVTFLHDQNRMILEIKQALVTENERDQTTTDLVVSAASRKDFIEKLSPRDALIWTLLAKQATEDRALVLTPESWSTSGAVGVPMATSFQDQWGTPYTVVVATKVYIRGGGTRFDPCLVFYTGSPGGGAVRMEDLDSSVGQYRVLGKWVNSGPQDDFSLLGRNVREKVEGHLKLASLH